MSNTQPQACNWGSICVDEDNVSLLRGENEPIFSIKQSNVGHCTIFRNDIKLQLKKQPVEINSQQQDQMFHTDPCEIKFTMPQDGDFGSDSPASAKDAFELISYQLQQARACESQTDVTQDPSVKEIIRMCPVTLSNPYGSFQLTITSSSLIFHKERKVTTAEEHLQTQFTVPLSSVCLTFMLPFPVSGPNEELYSRKYLVLVLSEAVQVKSTKHNYIICTFDDDDVYTSEAPLHTSISSIDDVATIFKGKIGNEESIYDEELSSVALMGAKSELFVKILKGLTGVKTFGQSSFQNVSSSADLASPYIKCIHRSSSGHLYFLEKYFLFLHKPAVVESLADIQSCLIEMETSYAKTFSLSFEMKGQDEISGKRKLKFNSIASKEIQNLRNWLLTKGIPTNEGSKLDGDNDDDGEYAESVSHGSASE